MTPATSALDAQCFLSPPRIAVVGLGYVGLPLALILAKHFATVGFDIRAERIEELKAGHDTSFEVEAQDLLTSSLQLSSNLDDLRNSSVYIIAVPTPVSSDKQPDLTPLQNASRMLAPLLKRGDIVVYESTVYPGCTREQCLPLLETGSGLRCDVDFAVGYSPERINPGDKQRRLPDIVKVVSATNPAARAALAEIYGQVISAGLHLASSIEVAEAAKALENTQRDVNIALMNEFAQMARRLDLDCQEVLLAAGTKWNFLPFRPGLVGGHCVGVDPYYLIFKAQQTGYFPELISAARRINESMPAYLASEIVKVLLKRGRNPASQRLVLLGGTFKPDCPDLRNTKIVELVRELRAFAISVEVYDPWIVDHTEAAHEGLPTLSEAPNDADVLVLAVAHQSFLLDTKKLRSYGKSDALLVDLQQSLPLADVDARI